MSDTGGGVPFRRIENLFSYMYSTAPAPQIGEHARTPLVSRRAAWSHSYVDSDAGRGVEASPVRSICHLVAFLLASRGSFTLFKHRNLGAASL